jgi:hypothetical protein
MQQETSWSHLFNGVSENTRVIYNTIKTVSYIVNRIAQQMGILFSYLPSIERNTMCCVDVTTRRACWEKPPSVHTPYHEPHAIQRSTPKVKDNTPANEVEFNAVVDVFAPVDTERMLAQLHFDVESLRR